MKNTKYLFNSLLAKKWSPYGCHYFPDPRNFPPPKLETLPKEPLLSGEQYFLDLGGKIRKGPVGCGHTCYCAPFFKQLINQKCRGGRRGAHDKLEKEVSQLLDGKCVNVFFMQI